MKISQEYYDLVDAGFATIIERLNLQPGQWNAPTTPRVFAWAWLGSIFTDLQYDDQHPTYKRRKRIVPQHPGFKMYPDGVKDSHWETVLRKIIRSRLNLDMDHPAGPAPVVPDLTLEIAAASLVNEKLYVMTATLASEMVTHYFKCRTVCGETHSEAKLEKMRKLFAAHVVVVRNYLESAIRADVTPQVLLELLETQERQDAAARVSDEGPQQRVICLSRNLQMNVTTAIDELKDIASFCQSAIETDNPKQVTPARKLQRQAVALRTKLEERMRPPTAQEVQNITDWQKKAREYASYRH